MEESTKSLDYNPQQTWLIASWMLGDQGADIRQPVVDELARLIDTAVAGRLTMPFVYGPPKWRACTALASNPTIWIS